MSVDLLLGIEGKKKEYYFRVFVFDLKQLLYINRNFNKQT